MPRVPHRRLYSRYKQPRSILESPLALVLRGRKPTTVLNSAGNVRKHEKASRPPFSQLALSRRRGNAERVYGVEPKAARQKRADPEKQNGIEATRWSCNWICALSSIG
jgi:hypothetical protein